MTVVIIVTIFFASSGKNDSFTSFDGQKNTVLIYMIGSDLESRGGAGTEDMEELKNSGINTENTKIVVFAGGTPMWHNDINSTDKINVLELTENGFEVVTHMDISSMGTAESLAEFLTYGYENYPADSFGLVMWDHGNGPNIGYGKDMLFDKDSLTLAEMNEALALSPFGPANKLDWVGFDACLMSSAELACVWDDYAYYLVASQEIEPSFGWNYSVFGLYDSKDTEDFISALSETYLATCVDHYNKKGITGKEFTLACVDLSYGGELENAINTLFSKAAEDVGDNYNHLIKSRVATRAFGRATTSSEYDLIDLYDMAVNLGDLYPEETAAITEITDKMVLNNANNTMLCCGLSMYYPFYNKYFFENGWSEAYENIGVFDSYRKYLESYQQIWLEESDTEKYATELIPEKVEEASRADGIAGTYTLALSPKQNETFAEARVYILEKSSSDSDTFASIVSYANVTNENGILYADVSGKAIYAVDSIGTKTIPVTWVNDKVGDISRFSCRMSAVRYKEYSTTWNESEAFLLQFALNDKTEELSLVSVLPYTVPSRADEISSTKIEDINLEDWDEYHFLRVNNKYFTKTESGIIPPFNNWVYSGLTYSEVFYKETGLGFVYESIDDTENHEYYVMFEITDTQGGMYCSELLRIDTGNNTSQNEENIQHEDIILDWDTNDETEIFNGQNVSVTLKKQFNSSNDPKYIISAKNNNDFPVTVYFRDILLNDLYLRSNSYILTPDGNSEDSSVLFSAGYDLKPHAAFDIANIIDRIDGHLFITNKTGNAYLVNDQKIIINSTGTDGFANLDKLIDEEHTLSTFRGALAERQVLYEDEKSRITLLMFGTSSVVDENLYILFENLSSNNATMTLSGIAVNGRTIDTLESTISLPGNSKQVKEYIILDSDYTLQRINQIRDVSLCLSIKNEDGHTFDSSDNSKWFSVLLKESAEEQEQSVSGQVVYDKNDICITVTDFDMASNNRKNPSPTWHAFVENNSDYNITLYPTDENNSYSNINISQNIVGARQSAFIDFTWGGNLIIPEDIEAPLPCVSFSLHMFCNSKILFYADELITLHTERPPDKTLYLEMSSDSIKLAENQNITLYLVKEQDDNGKTSYGLKFDMYSDDLTAKADIRNFKINGNIVLDSYRGASGYGSIATQITDFVDIDPLYSLYGIDSIESISGNFTVYTYPSGNYGENTYIFENQPVKVTFTGDGRIDFPSAGYERAQISPFMDALAENQILYEDEKRRISLLSFGIRESDENGVATLCFENKSNYPQEFHIKAFSVNSITNPAGTRDDVPAKSKTFMEIKVTPSWLEKNRPDSIEDIEFFFQVRENIPGQSSDFESLSAKAVMKQHGTATPFIAGENVVFDKNGISIIVNGFSYELYSTANSLWQKLPVPTWDLTIINDTYFNIDLHETIGYRSLHPDFEFSKTIVAAHQRLNCTLTYTRQTDAEEFPIRVLINDWDGERVFADDEMTVFRAVKEELVLTPFMDACAEEQILWETDEFRFTLLLFGNNNMFDEKMFFMLENFSDDPISVGVKDISVNSFTMIQDTFVSAPPHSVSYEAADISAFRLDNYKIKSINTLEFGMVSVHREIFPVASIPEDAKWVEIKLKEFGNAEESADGTNVIFDKSGVKIILEGFDYLDDGREAWDLTVVNSTDDYITFSANGLEAIGYDNYVYEDMIFMTPLRIGPGKKIKSRIFYNNHVPHETLNVNFVIRDVCNNIIFRDDEIITLYTGDSEKFTKKKIQQ